MNKRQYQTYREHKKHTPDEFPYNTYLCTIPLDFSSVEIHWHDEIELIIIKKGEGLVWVDLVEYEVTAGDIVFVPSGKLHSIGQKDSEVMEYENIIFKPSLLLSESNDLCGESFIKPICSGEIQLSPLIGRAALCYSEASALIARIDSLCDQKAYGYQLAVKGCIFQLMYLLLTEGNIRKEKINKKTSEKLKLILIHISENYQRQISIEEISGQCFYSKSYFMKFFKETMGVTFVEYLNNYRLDIAAEKLKSTDDNILNIAIDCGFDNLSYFNRRFKSRFGVSPGIYRRG